MNLPRLAAMLFAFCLLPQLANAQPFLPDGSAFVAPSIASQSGTLTLSTACALPLTNISGCSGTSYAKIVTSGGGELTLSVPNLFGGAISFFESNDNGATLIATAFAQSGTSPLTRVSTATASGKYSAGAAGGAAIYVVLTTVGTANVVISPNLSSHSDLTAIINAVPLPVYPAPSQSPFPVLISASAASPVPVILENSPAPYLYTIPYPGSSPAVVSGEYFGASPQPTLSPGTFQAVSLNVYGDQNMALDPVSGSGLLSSATVPGYVRLVSGPSANSPQANLLSSNLSYNTIALETQSALFAYTAKSTNGVGLLADYNSNCAAPYCGVLKTSTSTATKTVLGTGSTISTCTVDETNASGTIGGIYNSSATAQTGTISLYDDVSGSCPTSSLIGTYTIPGNATPFVSINMPLSNGLSHIINGSAFTSNVTITRN